MKNIKTRNPQNFTQEFKILKNNPTDIKISIDKNYIVVFTENIPRKFKSNHQIIEEIYDEIKTYFFFKDLIYNKILCDLQEWFDTSIEFDSESTEVNFIASVDFLNVIEDYLKYCNDASNNDAVSSKIKFLKLLEELDLNEIE